MKFILILVFTGYSIFANAQQKRFYIDGEVKSPGDNKYACLFIFNPIDVETILKTPILNNHFTFKGEVSYNGYLSKSGAILLTNDTTKIFSDSYKSASKMLIIDSLSILVQNQENIKYATIKGSVLNKELDELNEAMKKQEYLNFFDTHKDSIVSITMLNVLIAIDHMLGFGKPEYKRIFSTLSTRIQQSIEGKKVAKILSKE